MDKEGLINFNQLTCDHPKQRMYSTNQFDILNGFEIVSTKCSNCHKIISIKIKKMR
jgi:hypothetical protein